MIRLALTAGARDLARLERCARQVPGAELVASAPAEGLGELLGSLGQKIDAVLVCGPPQSRADDCELVARAGKHVLAGAPLASTLAEGQRVASTCSDAGVRLLVEQPARHDPALVAVGSSIVAGELGEPVLLRVHRWSSGESLDMTNEIDLVQWCFGREPERIWAVAQGSDMLQAHLAFSGNAMALVDVASGLPGRDGYFSATLVGSRGSAYADDHRNTQLLFGGEHARALKTDPSAGRRRASWTALVEALGREEESSSVAASLSALAITDAIAASIRVNRPVIFQGGRHELV